MAKSKSIGFRYYVSDEMLERYRKKPIALRLQWLYMANVLRMGYGRKTIEMQDRFREGKIWPGRGDKDMMQVAKRNVKIHWAVAKWLPSNGKRLDAKKVRHFVKKINQLEPTDWTEATAV